MKAIIYYLLFIVFVAFVLAGCHKEDVINKEPKVTE